MSISRSASSTLTLATNGSVAAPLADGNQPEIIGSSLATNRLRLQIRRIGPHFRTVLVRGEVGTDKELVARALHGTSPVRDRQFVVGDAVTFEDVLAECERHPTSSPRSTLFLDGVDEMSLAMQDRLLRALQEHEATHSRQDASRTMDSRMIASTSEDLRVMASTGRFRQELYQRLATVEILVPPLRERLEEDLPELARCFLSRFAVLYGRRVGEIATEAMERIQQYHWPGNVTELERVLRSSVLQSEGTVLESRHLPVLGDTPVPRQSNAGADGCIRLQDVVERHVLRVLKDCG
jgi:DNA-binding NtrC family response regulator